MKAFVSLGGGQAGWAEKEIPQATGFDGVLRPLLVSPCTSDVHNVAIDCLAPNRTLGHEGLGEIVAVGDQVKEFQVGEIVVVPPVTPNWRTVPSQLGAHQHCEGLITGQKLSNSEDGLMAEYALIRDLDANAARIPPGVSREAAVLAADMLNTGLYGAQLADVQPGDTVVVLGVGPVGLMAVAGARLRGAGRIIAIGSRPAGMALARTYGATDLINYREEDVTRRVHLLTDKQGADCCICAGGGPDALGQAVAMVRWGGTVGNVNYFATYGDLPINSVRYGFGMGNKTIRGGECPGGRARMEKLLALLQYGRVDPTPLITHRFQGLDQVEAAFRLMAQKPPSLVKTMVAL
ncbi:MAG: zinc-binding dehydrogenase [Clostridiales bacterium]|nr:zinc-binding dehydrogenase [Clostridiales bacterium]